MTHWIFNSIAKKPIENQTNLYKINEIIIIIYKNRRNRCLACQEYFIFLANKQLLLTKISPFNDVWGEVFQ